MDRDTIKGVSLLKSSSYRLRIVDSIGDTMKTPSEIAKETGIRLNHISNFLRDLKEHNIVECLNEAEKKGRLYRVTQHGVNVLEEFNRKG